jgi:uncharacterized protein YecE (DUF72 family)
LGEYYIGAGGWAYFQVPGFSPLVAYSKAFNFVEVNSTFYKIPSTAEVEVWRKAVPQSFHFSVRVHRSITHNVSFELTKELYESFEKMQRICLVLNADALHLQFPPSFKASESAGKINELLNTIKVGKLSLVMEIRGESGSCLPHHMAKIMQDHHIIHCVDLLRGEVPAYKSDILYSRLFGMGEHNIYQPDDNELLLVDKMSTGYQRVYQTFHGAKMYSDAARLKTYRKTGKFPMVTKTTGLDSLESVLKQDAAFPLTKQALICDQGWKLFDMREDLRLKAGAVLERLPDRSYNSLNEVMEELHNKNGGFLA